MTLIARFKVHGIPIMLGDLLVTTDNYRHALVSIPVSRDINRSLHGRTYEVAGLHQKITIFNDRLAVAFAGSPDQAKDVAECLSFLARSPNLNRDDLINVLNAIEHRRTSNLHFIAILLTPSVRQSAGFMVDYFSRNVKMDSLAGFEAIYLAGSGTRHLLSTMRQTADQIPKISENAGFWERRLVAEGVGLSLAAHFTGLEFMLGSNVFERWGGGFELLTVGADGFEKYDNIIHIFWRIVPDRNGEMSLLLHPKFVKNQYWNDNLLIRILEFNTQVKPAKERRNEIFVVPPILYHDADLDWSQAPQPRFDQCNALCSYVFYRSGGGAPDRCFTHVAHGRNGVDLFKIASEGGSRGRLVVTDELLDLIRGRVLEEFGVDVN